MIGIKTPVSAGYFEPAEGGVVRRIVDADGREILRGVVTGDDMGVLMEIARAINAANESQAIAEITAKYQASHDYLKEQMDKMRRQLLDEIAMYHQANEKLKQRIAQLESGDLFGEAV